MKGYRSLNVQCTEKKFANNSNKKSRTVRQEQEIKGIRIRREGKERKCFLFTDSAIFVGRKS